MLTSEQRHHIASELLYDFSGKLDGGRKNILIEVCPFCGHTGKKYAVYVGKDGNGKRFGMSNCFSCNRKFRTLKQTLDALGRSDLIPNETVSFDDDSEGTDIFLDDEIDDNLEEIVLPKGYKRSYKNPYLKSRGWIPDDFEYFPAGTNRGVDRAFEGYVILEIRDGGKCVGYVARNTMSKEDIDYFNSRHSYKIMRYKNSNEMVGNGFSKLIYNYDAIEPMETHSVILCEGAFDVVALNRKLELYENKSIVPVATFGKKVSMEQMYKLQKKGVEQVIVGFDNDAKETTSQVAMELDKYFDVLIADIPDGIGKDWDEMDVEDIYDVFTDNLKTIREFNLS